MFKPSDQIYNHDSSDTYERKYTVDSDNDTVPEESSITYGSGSAITEVGQDTITVGNRELENFTLMEIKADSLQLLHTSTGVAGVLGMQHMKNRSLGHSLFSRLRDAGKMTAFGYCRGTGNNGTFIWGAPEPTGSSGKTLEVVGQMHWAVKLGSINVANASTNNATSSGSDDSSTSKLLAKRVTSLEVTNDDPSAEDVNNDDSSIDVAFDSDVLASACANSSCIGILDSGSNIIAGPQDVMKAVTDKLNVQPDCSNFDQLPTITLNYGGYLMNVSPSGYVMKIPKPDADMSEEVGGDDELQGSEQKDVEVPARGLGGLSEKTSLDAQSAIKQQWVTTFERLKKKRGIDFGDVLKNVLKHENATKEEFLCMPALVPIDMHTSYGPLYIVGTPLLQNYYARWAFDRTPLVQRFTCNRSKKQRHAKTTAMLTSETPSRHPSSCASTATPRSASTAKVKAVQGEATVIVPEISSSRRSDFRNGQKAFFIYDPILSRRPQKSKIYVLFEGMRIQPYRFWPFCARHHDIALFSS
jgi:hypothetical protein